MVNKYIALPTVSLTSHCSFTQPDNLPKVVHLNNDAFDVLIDFQRIKPLTISQDKRMYDARLEMEASDLHFILVLDDFEKLVGVLSLAEVLGRNPVKLSHDKRIERKSIPVKAVMTTLDDVVTLDFDCLRYARVGNIVTTLNEVEKDYIVVVEIDDATHTTNIRGLFLAQRITQQLGSTFRKRITKAHSLAELAHNLHSFNE